MESVVISVIVIVLTFLAGVAGLRVQTWLDEHNSVEKSRDMIGSVLGLLSLLLALVLGTLIGNTYYFSTNHQTQLQGMLSNVVLLDKALSDFGPQTKLACMRVGVPSSSTLSSRGKSSSQRMRISSRPRCWPRQTWAP